MRSLIENYFKKLKNTLDCINRKEVETFIKTLLHARNEGRTIFIMGNGGSAATASHFCCDFNKGASYGYENKKRFKFVCLNDNIATLMAYANDVSYDDIFVEQLKNFLEPNDVVIGISGSGNSPNVLKAIEYANSNGGISVGLTGYNGGKLKQLAKYTVNTDINDMQVSEDIHMLLAHMAMQIINSEN